MSLSHLQALLLFAFVISLAFAFLTKRKLSERLRYALWAFLAFLIVAVAIGWLMYPFSR
jgi:heme A synthase